MKIILGNKNYSSWSLRPWLVLAHFEIPSEETVIPLDKGDFKKEIKKVSPSGTVPALIDGDITVWDSLAIINYLAALYPEKPIWPVDKKQKALAFSITAEMHSGFSALREFLPMNIRRRSHVTPTPEVVKDIERIEQIWAEALTLSGGPYLFKDFSAADAMFAPVVMRFNSYYQVLQNPLAIQYVETILDNPSLKNWINEALKEEWHIKKTDNMHSR